TTWRLVLGLDEATDARDALERFRSLQAYRCVVECHSGTEPSSYDPGFGIPRTGARTEFGLAGLKWREFKGHYVRVLLLGGEDSTKSPGSCAASCFRCGLGALPQTGPSPPLWSSVSTLNAAGAGVDELCNFPEVYAVTRSHRCDGPAARAAYARPDDDDDDTIEEIHNNRGVRCGRAFSASVAGLTAAHVLYF
uniref:Peptidase A1 domain-containing protein n=1 Tax=Macrostomum lignano TaxID=282301 RepID=A0A1I8F636_9PLAT